MPRPVHFEIHADNPERAMKFYGELFGWTFTRWGEESYWLIGTGERDTPGIDGGLVPRRGAGPTDMQPVNAFVCIIDVPDVDAALARVAELGGVVAVPKMPIPTVGWLAYGKDPEGNLFGMMKMDANAQ
jgi:hypothetical protein